VMLTIPPSQNDLDQIILAVQPERIFWFGMEPPANEMEIIIKTIVQSIKFGFSQNQFTIDLNQLASQMAITIEIAKLIASWLAARGDITIEKESTTTLQLMPGGTANPLKQEEFKKKIQKSLSEIQAFRRFALRCDPSDLVDHA
jgi:hypothetical protein